jgi:hypothetical protein
MDKDHPADLSNHIEHLNIPRFHPANLPCLLLHDLGQVSHDDQLVDRVKRLFTPGRTTCVRFTIVLYSGFSLSCRFLYNTSGSGKTRLLFKGLCAHWGFYFTTCVSTDAIGSEDLATILDDLQTDLTSLPEDGYDALLKRNRDAARTKFTVMLYIRMHAFKLFLEFLRDTQGGVNNEYKTRWLLLQVCPLALGFHDFFKDSLSFFPNITYQNIRKRVVLEKVAIEKILGQGVPIFHVIDEAQVPAKLYAQYFRSPPRGPRSVLRELVVTFTNLDLRNLLVSGTGISMTKVKSIVDTAVSKIPIQQELFKDIGAFDSEASQRKYLERYVPPGFFSTRAGEMLSARLAFWLHGR